MRTEDYNALVRRKPSLLASIGLDVEPKENVKTKPVRESEIHKQVAAWCRRHKINCSSSRMDKPTGRPPGEHDFTIWVPGGKPLCIEAKTATGVLSDDQEEWIASQWVNGYKVHVIRSYVEFLDLVREFEL